MVEPDGVTDDLRWKTKTAAAGRFGIDHTSLSNPGQLDHTMPVAPFRGKKARMP